MQAITDPNVRIDQYLFSHSSLSFSMYFIISAVREDEIVPDKEGSFLIENPVSALFSSLSDYDNRMDFKSRNSHLHNELGTIFDKTYLFDDF